MSASRRRDRLRELQASVDSALLPEHTIARRDRSGDVAFKASTAAVVALVGVMAYARFFGDFNVTSPAPIVHAPSHQSFTNTTTQFSTHPLETGQIVTLGDDVAINSNIIENSWTSAAQRGESRDGGVTLYARGGRVCAGPCVEVFKAAEPVGFDVGDLWLDPKSQTLKVRLLDGTWVTASYRTLAPLIKEN